MTDIQPSFEAYEYAIDKIRSDTYDDKLIERVFEAIPAQAELDDTLGALGEINAILGCSYSDEGLRMRRDNTFELGALAGMLVALEVHERQFPASHIFATTRPQAYLSDKTFFSDIHEVSDAAKELVNHDQRARQTALEVVQGSIHDAGLDGLRYIGSNGQSKVRNWSYNSVLTRPKQFQLGFGFSIIGALSAQAYVQNSITALIDDPEYNTL